MDLKERLHTDLYLPDYIKSACIKWVYLSRYTYIGFPAWIGVAAVLAFEHLLDWMSFKQTWKPYQLLSSHSVWPLVSQKRDELKQKASIRLHWFVKDGISELSVTMHTTHVNTRTHPVLLFFNIIITESLPFSGFRTPQRQLDGFCLFCLLIYCKKGNMNLHNEVVLRVNADSLFPYFDWFCICNGYPKHFCKCNFYLDELRL